MGKRRIFVYEYLSGGGVIDGDDAAREELLPLGLSMRDAMVADLLQSGDCHVTVAAEPGATVGRGAVAVAPEAGESPFDFVSRQAASADLAWIVAPETDGLLTRMHGCVPPSRWLGCDAAAITLASGKRATLRHLASQGVCTPLAFERAPETRRWVVKPDDGAGAVATHVHAGFDAALADQSERALAGARSTLEAWVEGEALSVSLMCRGGRADMLSINKQRIEIDAHGQLRYCGVDVHAIGTSGTRAAAIGALVNQVLQAIPGLRGFVGIDLVWHATRGPVLIEVNPRVTCAYIGQSVALGRNLATEWMAAHTEEWAHAQAA